MEQRQRLSHKIDKGLAMRFIFLILPFFATGQSFQLAAPRIQGNDVFFKEKTSVELEFGLTGATILYAVGENGPFKKYQKALHFRRDAFLQVKSQHPDYKSSEVQTRRFIKANYSPEKAKLLTAANEAYPARAEASLFDLKKGSKNIHDGNWLGFLQDTVDCSFYFKDETTINRLIISHLSDENAWIMPFKKVEVFGIDAAGMKVLLADFMNIHDTSQANYSAFSTIDLKKQRCKQIQLRIIGYGKFPPAHAHEGSQSWMFLDEIIFQ
jgi:hexosaminidase